MHPMSGTLLPDHEGIVVTGGNTSVTVSETGVVALMMVVEGIKRGTKTETTLYLMFPPEMLEAFVTSATNTLKTFNEKYNS